MTVISFLIPVAGEFRASKSATMLKEWHDKLSDHFSNLHKQRLEAHCPVFAIEHGLGDRELNELKRAIRAQITAYAPFDGHWLPWIVYAAEVGYEFDGHEYWDSFAEKTPNWKLNGDRHFIKNCYRKFVQSFGGFKPSGIWAEHFTIICYPITHAVLPKDLQRQLAKILYNLRFQFSRSFLQSSQQMGGRIAERSDEASRRFRQFAENTELVGLIARALLFHDESESGGVILRSTLERIVEDLRRESDAGSWLDQARSVAKENLCRGGRRERVERQDSPRAELKPDLTLRPTGASNWDLYLEIPDLLPLAGESAKLREFLETSRPKINGSFYDKRLGSGKLISYGSLREKLKSLPDENKPLLLFRREKPESLTKFLKDEFALKTKNKTLFKKRADGIAYKQESNVVRPGADYLILCGSAVQSNSLITKQNTSCENSQLYLLNVPKAISADDDTLLASLGLRTDLDVKITPIGATPAAWNEENRIDWLAGDSPCFALELNRELEGLKLEFGGDRLEMRSPPVGEALFVNLPHFPIGSYRLSVFGKTERLGDYGLLGDAEINIREPRAFSPDSTTSQNVLLLFTDPFRPNFEQFFSDKVNFEFWTPSDTTVDVVMRLLHKDSDNNGLLKQKLTTLSLPAESRKLNSNIREKLKDNHILRKAEQAHSCKLEFDAGELGTVTVDFEREFLPIKWEAKTDGNGQIFLRLSDYSDSGEEISVARYNFITPDKKETVLFNQADDSGYPISSSGGLFVAETAQFKLGIVVMRRKAQNSYKSFAAIGQGSDFIPQFVAHARNVENLAKLIELYALWTDSSSVGNVFGKTDINLIAKGLLLEILSLIDNNSGWRRAEKQYEASRFNGYSFLCKAISPKFSLNSELSKCCNTKINISLEGWIDELVSILGAEAPSERIPINTGALRVFRPVKPDWFVEFALRLCSRPDTLRKWASERYELGLKKMLERPTLVRAARFVVLTARGEKLNDNKHRAYKWDWE